MSNRKKLNANAVGANCIRPHFEGMTLKREKGITLIALIITIIVMLILVGVTINIALNGGLFTKADEAKEGTQKVADEEELQLEIVAAYDEKTGDVELSILKTNLENKGWKDVTISGDKLTSISPKGYKFTVLSDGKIEEGGASSGGEENITPELPKEENGSGEEDLIVPELPEGLTEGSEFEMDADDDGTKETWIVLYDGTSSHLNENEIEVISKNTMGEILELGYKDKETIENANEGKELYSYNNAIDRLNNYCDSLIKIDNLGVRSVGSLPSNPSYRNTSKPYKIQNIENWANKSSWYEKGILAEDADNNSDSDIAKLNELRILGAGAGYWLASRNVIEYTNDNPMSNYVSFYVRCVRVSTGMFGAQSFKVSNRPIWSATAGGSPDVSDEQFAVRPVIKLQYP